MATETTKIMLGMKIEDIIAETVSSLEIDLHRNGANRELGPVPVVVGDDHPGVVPGVEMETNLREF